MKTWSEGISPPLIGLLVVALALILVANPNKQGHGAGGNMEECEFPAPDGNTKPLCLPTQENLAEFDKKFYRFLSASLAAQRGAAKAPAGTYLDWRKDKSLRNTGDFINSIYYGTHPAARIYYSPGAYKWIKNGRRGAIPDGEMIIKEMFKPPALRYAADEHPGAKAPDPYSKDNFFGWTVMVKNSRASKDGWLWGDYSGKKLPERARSFEPPYPQPSSNFGMSCLNCHTIAERESTFSDLANIEGERGTFAQFTDDRSWKTLPQFSEEDVASKAAMSPEEKRLSIPPETYDHVVRVANAGAGGAGHQRFITSDQCAGCHDGQSWSLLHNMVVKAKSKSGIDANLGQFGEWRWSLMGLAGRDPIFYAQLQSEITIHNGKKIVKGKTHMSPGQIQDACLGCHGVMGQRQFHIDNGPNSDLLFSLKDRMRHPGDEQKSTRAQIQYAALGRDGISCMICHQIKAFPFRDLPKHVTGNFELEPADESGNLTIRGPYKKVIERPMENMLSVIPKEGDFIKSSEVCASCHTIVLPVLDENNNVIKTAFEQSTYLEWLNSDFGYGGKTPARCQDCHMSQSYKGKKLERFQIANIQDQTFPEATEISPLKDRTVPTRKDFSRHVLAGINVFGLEMFNQFSDVLGVNKKNFMTTWDTGLQLALNEANQMAENDSAAVKIGAVRIANKRNTDGNPAATLIANVTVRNKTGHRFPSGVGFRRAFLEFSVRNKAGETIWVSGATNGDGRILGKGGKVLPSEKFDPDPSSPQHYQPHYQKITSENEVQIYQELVKNPEGRFTASFLSIAEHFKDNRLLPAGWRHQGSAKFQELPEADREKYIDATRPVGSAARDKDFTNGTGSDVIQYEIPMLANFKIGENLTVTAALYYQAIPPIYLDQRFHSGEGKNKNANTDRLKYLVRNLKTKGTSIEGWKLKVASDSVAVK